MINPKGATTMKITLTKDQAYTLMTALELAKYDEDDNLSGFEQQENKKYDRLIAKIRKAVAEDKAQ